MRLKNIHRFELRCTIQTCREAIRGIEQLNNRSGTDPIDCEEIRVSLALALEAGRLADMGCEDAAVTAYRRFRRFWNRWNKKLDALMERRGK